MRFQQKINLLITSALLITPIATITSSTQVKAATFTSSEISDVKRIQNEYAALPKTTYSSANLYATAPHLTAPFSEGKLADSYISSTLAYINFYRSLFGLLPISSNATDNDNAQITASVMAAINASPFVNQHGLPNEKKPDYIKDMYWNIAQTTSASSNLNFNVTNQSAGDVVTDLLTDRYNLDGSDTGHRAWLLSTRLTTTGIGAAYGSNGYRYSVQQMVFPSDSFKAASKATVTYPTSGIFPIELLQGNNVAWSVYLSDQLVSSTPQITITDLDTGQTSNAVNVRNFSNQGYGNFASVITYSPGNINLVSGHEYMVQIKGITSYSFKLFNEVATNQIPLQIESSKKSNQSDTKINNTQTAVEENSTPTQQQDVSLKSALLLKAEKLRDTLRKNRQMNPVIFGRSYQDGKHFYNLGTYQWFHDFYIVNNPDLEAGIINTTDTTIDTNIYSSPYLSKQNVSVSHVIPGQSYAYGQTIKIGKTKWYYLGQHQWIRQQITKSPIQKH